MAWLSFEGDPKADRGVARGLFKSWDNTIEGGSGGLKPYSESKIERLCGGTAGYRVTEYATERHIFYFMEMKVLIKTLLN